MSKLVVHCRKEPFDIYIGRPSKWGNPFSTLDYPRHVCISAYRQWLLTGNNFNNPEATEAKRQLILESLPELKDKVLGCWCSPLPCHGNILLELLNERT